jgi:hypothetical protein
MMSHFAECRHAECRGTSKLSYTDNQWNRKRYKSVRQSQIRAILITYRRGKKRLAQFGRACKDWGAKTLSRMTFSTKIRICDNKHYDTN